MYNKYVEGSANKKLDRLKFRDILHDMFGMTDDMLMDRGDCLYLLFLFFINTCLIKKK